MKYYLIAGEASGDLYGALLIRALQAEDHGAQFRFWGGDVMSAEAGASPVRHIRDLAIMGFVEVVEHLDTVLGNLRFCKQDILSFQPDVVVGIDYPGFNLKIEKWAHGRGLHTVHYISPNLWAWKKDRIRGMRKSLDRLCYILPFEEQFFAENNMPQAVYVGHPLLDAITDYHAPDAQKRQDIIALLPGSRRQELKHTLPLMVQLAAKHPEFQFKVAGMSMLGAELYNRYIPAKGNIEVLYDQTYSLLSQAHAAVVCSGTATLEAALFDVPQVVCYRANPVSIAIAKSIVSRRIQYISLVNLIANQTVVTELIQEDFNTTRLDEEFCHITKDATVRARMLDQYARMRQQLGDGGASRHTAQEIVKVSQNR